MSLDPSYRDIVPIRWVWIRLYFFSENIFLVCEVFNNVLVLEQGVPGLDGGHAMEEIVVEHAGHDDGVTWVLVEQGFLGFLPLRFCDLQNGAATIRKGSDGIPGVIGFGMVLMEIDAVVFTMSV